MDQGGIAVLFAMLMLVVWLFAILVLTERKSGYMISLIVSSLNVAHSPWPSDGDGGGGNPRRNPHFQWTLLRFPIEILLVWIVRQKLVS
jgi:hypothetical protein